MDISVQGQNAKIITGHLVASLLEPMEQVTPWSVLVALIGPNYTKTIDHFFLHTKLLVHLMRQWFTLSDPETDDTFFDIPVDREFSHLFDGSTFLSFRHPGDAQI